jgi:hypothetical protein
LLADTNEIEENPEVLAQRSFGYSNVEEAVKANRYDQSSASSTGSDASTSSSGESSDSNWKVPAHLRGPGGIRKNHQGVSAIAKGQANHAAKAKGKK